MIRKSSIHRKTNETDISIEVGLDGQGSFEGSTGIGFLDHMLKLLAVHGFLNMDIKAKGDLEIDCHHTVEDIAIVLGLCLREALGDKKGIKRYGTSFVPMDEVLANVSLDISGRACLVFDASFTKDRIGDFDTEMVEEFFRSVAFNAGITLHVRVLYGKNNHHMVEAIFKAFGKALSEAVSIDPRVNGILSSKGIL